VRFKFVDVEKINYPVGLLCRVLQVSTSGYYEWRKRPISKRATENEALTAQIKVFHLASRNTYGAPRIHQDLKDGGQRISKKRVARLMRLAGIRGVHKLKHTLTTDSNHKHPIASNTLDRDFTATHPNQKWVADITYIWTWEGWLYLAVVIDLYSRKAVGWAMGETMGAPLVSRALRMAASRLTKIDFEALLFHSDQGSQYASHEYRAALAELKILQSMSRKGNCWDNAVAESFFATLKKEEIHRKKYQTKQQAKSAIFSYIEGFYNPKRRHSYLGGISPVAFEALSQDQSQGQKTVDFESQGQDQNQPTQSTESKQDILNTA
jgi:transposase InsO family protein